MDFQKLIPDDFPVPLEVRLWRYKGELVIGWTFPLKGTTKRLSVAVRQHSTIGETEALVERTLMDIRKALVVHN